MSPFARIRHLLHEAVWVYLRPYWKLHALHRHGVVVRGAVRGVSSPHDPVSRSTRRCCRTTQDKLDAGPGRSGGAVRRRRLARRWVLAVVRAHYLNGELYWDLYTSAIPLAAATAAELLRPGAAGAFRAAVRHRAAHAFARWLRDLFERGLQAMLQLRGDHDRPCSS